MTPIVLLGLLSLGMFGASLLSGDSDDDAVEDTDDVDADPDVDMNPEEPAVSDTGVAFSVEGDTITIDVGEDETGTVAALRTEIPSSVENDEGPDTQTIDYAVTFYLVPEDVEFPPSVQDVASDNADVEAQEDAFGALGIPLQTYLDNIGVEEIGSVSLGSFSFEQEEVPNLRQSPAPLEGFEVISDLRSDDFTIESNRDIESYSFIERAGLGTFGSDGETVYELPLVGLEDDGEVAAADVRVGDADITFENGEIDVVLGEGVEGDLVAIQFANNHIGDFTDHDVLFYVLPEGAAFPLTVEEVRAAYPEGALAPVEDSGVVIDGVPLSAMMDLVGGQFIGSVDVGFTNFIPSSRDFIFEDGLLPFVIADGLEYQGFTWSVDTTQFLPLVTNGVGGPGLTPVDSLSQTSAV